MTNWNSELLAAVAAMADRAGVDTTTPAAAPDRACWNALSESGFTGIGIPEDQGGSGGTALDALSVLHAATTRGALTMLLEHSLASRIVAECTGGPATGPATLAFADGRCTVRRTAEGVVLDGTVTGVVHGAEAAVLVIVLPEPQAHPSVALVAAGAPGITVTRGSDLLGAAMDDYTFAGTPVDLHESPHTAADLEERGALAYTVALAAAAAAVRDRSVRYAAERTQFGRPLAKFQAVQQRLAGLTALAALLDTATAAAATADTATRRTAIAAAKVVASASAREVAAIGHQIHGALGFTSEHSLGRFTTALWSWRDRYGGERYWSHVLAGQILDDGADPWDLVTGATEPAAAEENAR
ncbi:acyl-CoA dehydrogenase family protein [Nocardia farcinica]|uniref:acyl-CoA dehydrogenase family protein n=1 Tax=Nocardia farcinica TaxID=37329 RepID=UPI001894D588|nr:acyl-CoA dehydrogenase family protein [Nocardia farcinica]MBF6387730.1 acyl-CoA dehydrogenase family protein [Nocardia farcinica]